MWIVAGILISLASGPAVIELIRDVVTTRDLAWRSISSAPNHFWFLIVFFPMIALLASFVLVGFVRHGEELFADPTRGFAQAMIVHWRVVVLLGVAFASVICTADYFFNPKTFDKLALSYRRHAFGALDTLRRTAARTPSTDRAEQARQTFMAGRDEVESCRTQLSDRSVNVLSLSPQGQLFCYTNATAQLRLRLLDPTSHTLQMVALLGVILTGWCMLWGWIICITCPDLLKGDGVVGNAGGAILAAILLFAVWVFLYHVAKAEIVDVFGVGTGTNQRVLDVVVGAFLIVLIAVMGRTKLGEAVSVGPEVISGVLIGVLLVVSNAIDLRSVFGSEGNPVTVVVVSILAWIIFAAVTASRMWR